MAQAKKIHSDLCSALMQASPAAMFLYDSRSLRILAANEKARARYGYSGPEFHLMTVRNLRPGGATLNTCLHLDDDAPSRSLWTHVTKQGEPFAVELSIVPFPRGDHPMAILSVTDATNWSEARLNLIRSEQIHRSLVDQCPFGIYRYDLVAQRYEHANPALLALLGYSLEELRSLPQPTLFADPAERDRYLAELRASGSVRELQARLRCRDGRTLRVTISGYLFRNPETGHICVASYVRDTTRQHELEEQLGAVDRMEAVGRFAGGVAHDFNNITQSIGLSCELALRASLPLAVRTKLFGILQQANRAAEITQRLLAFSGRQILQPRAVNLNDCIQEALPSLSRSLGINISMDLRLGDALPPSFVDPDQLTLVLIHLADNARVAMPDGGVLRISTGWAPGGSPGEAGAEPDASAQPCLLLTVSDTGVGMDEATRQRIFEPFFSTKKTTQTAGLGLATVHGIIHQSNGRIECESAPGRGSTFRIFLPIAKLPDAQLPIANGAPAEVPASAAPAPVAAAERQLRILLADADPLANRPLADELQAAGFFVDLVGEGEKALAAFARQPYSLVVAGVDLPGLGGAELTRRLRQLAPAIPVVLTAGRGDQGSVLDALPHSHIAYLQKPFAGSMLLAIIRNLLPAQEAG